MGLYNRIEEKLTKQFSIFQIMTLLGIGASDVRIARNLLKQFHQQGYIKRVSKNMYKKMEKVKESKPSKIKGKIKPDTLKKKKIPKTKIDKKQLNQNQISLTKLHRLGSKTEQKFIALGISSVNELIKENASDLAKLINGVSEDSIKEWIEEGKALLKK